MADEQQGLLSKFIGSPTGRYLALGLLNLSQNGKNPVYSGLLQQAAMGGSPQPENPAMQTQFSGMNPSYNLPQNPLDDTVGRLTNAIGRFESSNDYRSIGKQTRTGDRAYGRYQVMGANIPQWTKEILGYSLTPEQFLQSPEAQDAVARAKLGEYYQKTGSIDDAAAMWFSGRPVRNNTSRDILGTSVPDYVRGVKRYF